MNTITFKISIVKKFFLVLLVLLACHCKNQKTSSEKLDNKKETLLKALNDFNSAFEKGDIEKLNDMVTESYQHTNGNSKAIGKEVWFNYLRKRQKEIISGALEVLSYTMNDIEMSFYDNTAVITGKVSVKNKVKGEIRKSVFRVTHIWVYESDNWKRAGFHDGKIIN
ncbi:nuclear transport factor 2 family protein [Maribacter sp. 2210JD10-5]|uniref:nuclear transport factor 2 family protein n=1 Tax=Maribacter sp. 2210JD10-5 TaxID=3386272 RepID=UPI0039BC364D